MPSDRDISTCTWTINLLSKQTTHSLQVYVVNKQHMWSCFAIVKCYWYLPLSKLCPSHNKGKIFARYVVHDIPLRHCWVRKLSIKLRPWVIQSLTITLLTILPLAVAFWIMTYTNRSSGSCLSINSQDTFPGELCFCVCFFSYSGIHILDTHGHLLVGF